MKAVITGITGLRNRGVEALAVTTIEQLQQRQPQLSISILTETPDYDTIHLQEYSNIELLNASYTRDRLAQLREDYARAYKPVMPRYKTYKNATQGASAFIASGGDMFSSDYGVKSLHRHLTTLTFALDASVPVVFLAHSIGPFKTNEEVQAFLKVARRSTLITVREQLSYNYLTKDLGLSPNLVKHTADPAFLLAPPPGETLHPLLQYYGVAQGRPVVAVSTSQGISNFAGGCDGDQHFQAWKAVIQLILNELNAEVLIVPHVQELRPRNDDRILATQLFRAFEFNPRVRIVSANHSASEFKGLIGACDMVVAERMHAAIAGLSSGVCTVAVGYSVKAEGILTDLLGPESIQNGLLIPVLKFLDISTACETVRQAWSHRQETAAQLQQSLPQVKAAAKDNFDLLVPILR